MDHKVQLSQGAKRKDKYKKRWGWEGLTLWSTYPLEIAEINVFGLGGFNLMICRNLAKKGQVDHKIQNFRVEVYDLPGLFFSFRGQGFSFVFFVVVVVVFVVVFLFCCSCCYCCLWCCCFFGCCRVFFVVGVVLLLYVVRCWLLSCCFCCCVVFVVVFPRKPL